jgi:hypothetical protein
MNPTDSLTGLSLLTAMITPAVLISACGTLIFSTSTRLARVVDRARHLSRLVEQVASGEVRDFAAERRAEFERQFETYARRSQLVQASLTSFYLALGTFVGATIAIGLTAFLSRVSWVPSVLGIAGTVMLFVGCMLLITETRLAVRALSAEMAFTMRLVELYAARAVAEADGEGRDAR